MGKEGSFGVLHVLYSLFSTPGVETVRVPVHKLLRNETPDLPVGWRNEHEKESKACGVVGNGDRKRGKSIPYVCIQLRALPSCLSLLGLKYHRYYSQVLLVIN